MEKSLVIIFGKTGAGKSYLARMLEREFGYWRYEADNDLTPAMRKAIAAGQIFTEAMRDVYYRMVREKTKILLESNTRVVLAQGLFINQYRRDLMAEFPFAKFIWVKSDEDLLEKRIWQRNNEVTWEYARKINRLFEVPDFDCLEVLNNSGPEELLQATRGMFLDKRRSF